MKDIDLVLSETPEDMIMRKERTEEQGAMDCTSGVCVI